MVTVGFIGGYDKTELLLQIAKFLTLANKKVVLIDGTKMQKARYVVPTIAVTKAYITEFEGFDVAVGFENFEMLENYENGLNYDIALLDIDSPEVARNFNIENNYKNCFVTGFDLFSLKRGIELLNSLESPIKIVKVLFSKEFSKAESKYLDYLSLGAKVEWEKEAFNFPVDVGNYSVMLENETISRIRIKKLTATYKTSLVYFISNVFKEFVSGADAKKILKIMERI